MNIEVKKRINKVRYYIKNKLRELDTMQTYKQFTEEMNKTVYQFTEEELLEIYNSVDATTFGNVDDADDYYQGLEEDNFGDIGNRYSLYTEDNIAKHFESHMADEENFMMWIRQDKIKGDHLNMKFFYFKDEKTYGQAFGYGGDENW